MKSFCINLDRRPERWAIVREELNKQGFKLTRISGIDNGWRGCRDSHLLCLGKIMSGEVDVMVFEDDVLFLEDTSYIVDAISELPKDWDCLYLGASPQEYQERYSDHLFRLKNAFCMHAILWHPRRGGAIEYILNHRDQINKIDVFMADEIMPRFNVFLTNPLICTQRVTNTSDTCAKSDVLTIENNYKRFCV